VTRSSCTGVDTPHPQAHTPRMTLREVRQARGMTLQRLADLIGVYRQQIHVWEAGKVWPSKDVCRKLAEALGVSPRDVDWFGPDGEAK